MGTHLPPPAAWDQALQDAWPAVPAGDLLDAASEAWRHGGLTAPTADEAAALGLTGRLLKYGQSSAIALPLLGSETVIRLVVYLHRLRFDALQGGIRAPWLHPGMVFERPDVVLIGRPRARLHDLSRIPQTHPRLFRPGQGHGGDETTPQLGATWLLDGSQDMMSLIQQLEQAVRPFVVVIDASAAGSGDVRLLDETLADTLPEVPRVVLLTLGQGEPLRAMTTSRARTHLQLMRIGDHQRIGGRAAPRQQLVLLQPSDRTADEALACVFQRYFALYRLQTDGRDAPLQQALATLGKVLRGLNELVVPLPYLEHVLLKATRPGLYPVRTLARWLELSRNFRCAYGNSQVQLDALAGDLERLHALFMQSVTGKAESLLAALQGALAAERRVCVLTGTPHEATALEHWLHEKLDWDWQDHVQVQGMDGLKSYRSAGLPVDEVLITSALWPSRLHWLALPCNQLTVLAYPFEAQSLKRQIEHWWRQFGCASAPDGDKYRLWTLSQGTRRCLDADTLPAPAPLTERTTLQTGTYPAKKLVVQVPPLEALEDWLDRLLAEPPTPPAAADSTGVASTELVWIDAEEGDHIPWARTHPVLVLDGDKLEPRLPLDLVPGDCLVLMPQTDERVATQEALFKLFLAESHGLEQLMLHAQRWHFLVAQAAARYKPRELVAQLRKSGVEVTESTVNNWIAHRFIGPRDPKAIGVFARLAQMKDPARTAGLIGNAIIQVRAAHVRVGNQLRKAILERVAGADSVEVGSSTLDGETFDQMIRLVTVTVVRLPAESATERKPAASLVAVAEAVSAQYPGRLLFTGAALRAAKDSTYRELDRFRDCLVLMATRLYAHYHDKQDRMHDVLADFAALSITYKPGMSDVTMGMHGDGRRYKQRAADMNRHFRLGGARDKTRTLRIHFEWDEDDQVIVIHHAGEHLTTTQS